MKISRVDFARAATESAIAPEQAEALWAALTRRTEGRSRFDLAHVAYYFGAMLVISAMGWFMTSAWDSLSGLGISSIAAIYAVLFVVAGRIAWSAIFQIANISGPALGGLLFTMAVWMTPLICYGIETTVGLWPQGDPGAYREYHVYIRGSWIVMELATIVAGAFALRARKFPFLTFPIAFALWYMSMDLAPLFFGADELSFEQRAWISVAVGAVMISSSRSGSP